MRTFFSFILCFFMFSGYAQVNDSIAYSLFLLGYSGKYDSGDLPQTKLVNAIVNYQANPKGLVLTGNNLFPSLDEVLKGDFDDVKNWGVFPVLKQFDGQIGVVPGISDWAYGTSQGKEMVKWENKTIHKIVANQEVYMPEGACPGPVEIPVNDSLVIILLDTQWWLHPFDTRFGKCDLEDDADVWVNIRDVLRRNRNKQVVVVGYYPVVSYGEYGGYYSAWKDIFCFPMVGYRKFLGTRLDLSYPVYKAFADQLKAVLDEFSNVIYASSHERNFQYIKENKVHYVIGGSLSGGKYIRENKLECGNREAGYSRIDFYKNGNVELNFFSLNEPEKPQCSTLLYTYQPVFTPGEVQTQVAQMPDSAVARASNNYNISQKGRRWMGWNYRDVWSQPIKVPVFNIEKEHGGLTIVKRGGGQQTHSLRLEDANGHQYGLRSLEKYVEGALPDEVHNSFAIDVAQDNISASNPYAAMPVARLADAVGVMHTNPKVVFVPKDYRMGQYMEDLEEQLFLYEERPDGDWSKEHSFGFSSDIVGTDDVIENTEDHPKYQVDQLAVLKARLFDTFINDWDRHDDQWRWASYQKGKQTVYRPIPRDRDQAFFLNEGILPKIASRKWLMPKFQGMAPVTANMNGLAFNARYFDRAFLTEPDWTDWKQMVDSLKQSLTDDVIDQAMNAFPKEVQPLCAERIDSVLKQRRDNLEIMAREHYLSLAEKVDVVGTNKNDFFEVNRKNNEQTEVAVFHLSHGQKDETPYYHRVFLSDETKEIRLYGLKGDDYFSVDGEVDRGVLVRIIGGRGKDTIVNQSYVTLAGKQTIIYDRKKNTSGERSKDTKSELSEDKNINSYNRKAFHYDVVSPGIYTGYNKDDGLFIGGGPVIKKYRFRRNEIHTIKANFAMRTNAFNVLYNFDSESSIAAFDHHAGFELKAPDYAMNYFGMGNKSRRDKMYADEYYRLRVNQLMFHYGVGHRWGKKLDGESDDHSINQSEIRLGTFFKRSNIEEQPDHFISDLEGNGLLQSDLDDQLYTGISFQYTYQGLDEKMNPQRGVYAHVGGTQSFQLNAPHDYFFRMNADFRAYLSFTRNPRTVLALRFGGSGLLGDHSFLEAARLGGKTNLRGYLADRFYGDQSAYGNAELRYKVANFSSYLLNGEVGTLLFYDAGRVWLENENSNHWHKGYGGGIWISPFEMAVFTATFNHSREDNLFQVSMNFNF